jgi:hypothetical protein
MTTSSPGHRRGRRAADEVLDRVLPEPPTDDETPAPASPAGVGARRQAQLDAIGAPDRESW